MGDENRGRAGAGTVLLFSLSIFLSAALLFQVQFIVSKFVLPWFGGTPSVWSVSLLFFQTLLLGGYYYSHRVSLMPGQKAQRNTHLAVLAASLAAMLAQAAAWGTPLLPGDSWKEGVASFPTIKLLLLLTLGAGAPFFALSSTSSLLQAWLGRLAPGKSPYFLYAVSNAGSLAGLLSYPFVVEPAMGLRSQSLVWGGVYVVFALLCGAAAVRAGRMPEARAEAVIPDDSAGDKNSARLMWLGFSFCGSALLVATSGEISRNVVVSPLLWALPLTLYLLTFIVAFCPAPLYSRWLMMPLAFPALLLLSNKFRGKTPESMTGDIFIYCLAFFVCCMICHGELSRLKPGANSRLTEFYLCVAGGGAAGGVFSGLVAPLVFNTVWELFAAYLLAVMLVIRALADDKGSLYNGRRSGVFMKAAAFIMLAGLLLTAGVYGRRFYKNTIEVERNFYGIVRALVENHEDPSMRKVVMTNGNIIHGKQLSHPDFRRIPAAYYGKNSGAGVLIANHPAAKEGRPLRMGVVGLGAGTLAAYGRPGDVHRFYEINPASIRMASGEKALFTYVNDSPAKTEIIPGDARISLEREPPQEYDILVLDAFSGNSVPTHLLTLEAFELYLRHLKPDGVVAMLVSDRHLNLKPLLRKLGERLGLKILGVENRHAVGTEVGSSWVLMSKSADILDAVAKAAPDTAQRPPETPVKNISLWTDDHSDVFQLLRRSPPGQAQ